MSEVKQTREADENARLDAELQAPELCATGDDAFAEESRTGRQGR